MIRIGLCLFVLVIISLAWVAGVCADTIPAIQVTEPPKLDGDLSDACWRQAPFVSDFYFTSDGTKAAESTMAWLCYDQTNIYMAFRCKDSQPDKIVAQQTKRGGSISSDDWVGFDLDCFGTYSQIVWFDVSAGGVQLESLQSGDVSKVEWRGDWSATAKRLSDGYAVEIAIPFSILQYDAGRTSMGIAFIRRHARTAQWWWSPNVGPNSDAKKFYVWEGLKLPRPASKTLVLAYGLFSTGDGETARQVGVDVKHVITPGLTGLLTVNPDFRNVEQSADSVDFSYSERWRSDSRPFFQEGSGYFPGSRFFYTRRIKDVDTGLKVSGKVGDYGVGLARIDHFGLEHYSVLQVDRRWKNETQLQLGGVVSEAPGVTNKVSTAYFARPLYRKGDEQVWFDTQYATADSALGTGQGRLFSASFWDQGRPRQLHWSVGHSVIDADFDPYLGLVGEKDRRCLSADFWLSDEPSKGRVRNWYTDFWVSNNKHIDGSLFYNTVGVYADVGFDDGTGASIELGRSHRPPYHDATIRAGYSWGGRDLYRSGGANFACGEQTGGDYRYWQVYQGTKLAEKLSMSVSYEWVRIAQPSPEAFLSKQLVTGIAWDVDTERTLGGRVVECNGKTNLYLAFKQRVRSGMDVYAIFGDPNVDKTKRSFTLKLISPI